MHEQGLTRRDVLYGAAVVGAGAMFASRQRGTALSPGQRGSAAPAPHRGLVGATVSPSAMGTRTWREAARRFDSKASCPMAASAARLYWSGAGFDTGPGISMVRAMATAGVSAVLSFRPNRDLRASETALLRDSIRQCRAAGLKIDAVCLWHEPNDITQHPHPFRSARAYRNYVRHYGPTVVEMGIPLAYIPLVLTSKGVLQAAYFPGAHHNGRPLISRIYPDFYCSAQFRRGVRLDAPIRLAEEHSLQLGLGEFGRTNGPHQVSDSEFEAYMDYLTQVFAGRKNRASCMYFVNGPRNVPTYPGYAALRAFYNAITG